MLTVLGLSFYTFTKPVRGPGPGNPKVDKLKILSGFTAEHIYSPGDNKQGSWVSMTFDNKGRLIASDQWGFIYRLTIPPVGAASLAPKVEKLIIGPVANNDSAQSKIGMGYAQGMLYAFNSLYVMVNHNSNKDFDKGSGLYRLQDLDGDDRFETVTLLKALKGEGEHGPHSIKLSPDKKSLYVVAGNFTNVPQMDAYRLPSNWNEDNLFPLIKDPRGHGTELKAPGGWIANVDSTGKHWELIGAGMRNTFDIAFNEAGDLFAYDSDMEWDFGTPWYRPTRILHITSGSEYGWRTGNSTWSSNYPDNLPAVLNIGQGSPTNFVSGMTANVPEKYRRAMFSFDWSFGIIYAIHLKPEGSSYKAEAEEFISGSPLPLTDGVFGPDGALYFLTGGRGLESDLFRVYYGDNKQKMQELAPQKLPAAIVEAQNTRRALEKFHGAPDAAAVAFAWPFLKNDDRYIRYAARVAIEHQPVAQWQNLVLKETDPQIKIEGAIALAHQGKPEIKNELLTSLMQVNYKQLSETRQQDIVRAFELIFARMGAPDAAIKPKVISYLDANYPAKTNDQNRILCKVLAYLDAPTVVEKTMALMATAKDDSPTKMVSQSSDLILRNPQYGLDIANMLSKVPPAQQTWYAMALCETKSGWTPALRDTYFKWFYNAFTYKGGRSFIGFIDKARKMALQNVPPDRLAYYNAMSGDSLLTKSGVDLAPVGRPKGPGRNWILDTALATVENHLVGRNLEQGKAMFAATLCSSCHSMGGEGGAIGPDLSQLGTRFSAKDILEAIINPNKAISDQYAATVFYLKNGSSVMGRLINEDGNKYSISQNPFAPQTVREVYKKDVVRTRTSEISIMLPGLINSLNADELKDLMAYLISGGNKSNPVYTAK